MAVSLFVGNLEASVTGKDLRSFFGTIGKIASIRICRDDATGRSLGHGYINFEESADAHRAIQTLNCNVLNGRPVEIAWSWRDPAVVKCQNANVFVKNIHHLIDAKCLYETFRAFGELISCRVARDKLGVSKGYGYIQFKEEKDADECISKVKDMCIEGKRIYLARFIPKMNRETNDTNKGPFTNVYIKNLPGAFSNKNLYDLFEVYGDITSSKVVFRENGFSKRYGFVNFMKSEDAKKAVEELNGKPSPSGKKYFVGRAQKKSERDLELNRMYGSSKKTETINKVNIYVKNLDGTVTDERLKHEFSAFGTVTSAKVMKENGRSKGFGFVCFELAEQASNAIAHMNGSVINNNIIYVALAQRKADRLRRNCNDKSDTSEQEDFASNNHYRRTDAQHLGLPTMNQLVYQDLASNILYRGTDARHLGLPTMNHLVYHDLASNNLYRGTDAQHLGLPTMNHLVYKDLASNNLYWGTDAQHLGLPTMNHLVYKDFGSNRLPYRRTDVHHPGL